VPPPSLYELLGLSPDTAPAELRRAYEEAVRVATRAGDHRRAVELSTAYDALHHRLRGSIYPAARTDLGSVGGGATIHHLDPARARRRSRRRAGQQRSWTRRIVVVVIGAAVIALVALYVWQSVLAHPLY